MTRSITSNIVGYTQHPTWTRIFRYQDRFAPLISLFYIFIFIWTVSEFNEFKPRLKSPKTRFQLSAGLNLEKLNTILSGTNYIFEQRLKFKPLLKFFKFGLRSENFVFWISRSSIYLQGVPINMGIERRQEYRLWFTIIDKLMLQNYVYEIIPQFNKDDTELVI